MTFIATEKWEDACYINHHVSASISALPSHSVFLSPIHMYLFYFIFFRIEIIENIRKCMRLYIYDFYGGILRACIYLFIYLSIYLTAFISIVFPNHIRVLGLRQR